ncbi:ABC transporter permease [Oscillospiraceae bacterium NSJ-64]|uniref:ABC transporter permease n=2 Tax=Youxingia wuxianensis TaxID=2763678 RepID=A0A926EMD9_9FIRM|nr:ABC transporter permease [Youxingia wuxianensis]
MDKMLLDSLICSFRNLGRKKFRSILTISGISIGVASVVLIGSIGAIGKETINKELSSLGLGSLTISTDSKFTDIKMTEEDLESLREAGPVKEAVPIVVQYTNVKMRGLIANTVVWGVDDTEDQVISLEQKYGRMINKNDIASGSDVCVVDYNTAQVFYKRDNIVGKKLELMLGGQYVTLEIVGVAASGGNILQTMVGDMIPSFIYVPYTTVQRYMGDNTFSQIAVTLKDKEHIESDSEYLTAFMNRKYNIERGFKTDNISKQKDTLNNMLNIITMVLSSIAAVSLVVAGLGIMTIMIVSVNERTKEIGIKKSIGATKGIIMTEFLIEAFTISLIGSIIGVGTGMGLVWAGCMFLSIPMTIDFQMMIVSIVMSVAIGVIFGVYPATLAAKLRPVDAFRTE